MCGSPAPKSRTSGFKFADRPRQQPDGPWSLTLTDVPNGDLALLRGAPLNWLELKGTAVADLAPLRGMPLRDLDLSGCTEITDLSPLAEMQTLESLVLPPNAADYEFLRTFPKLSSLSFQWESAAQFWTEHDAKKQR